MPKAGSMLGDGTDKFVLRSHLEMQLWGEHTKDRSQRESEAVWFFSAPPWFFSAPRGRKNLHFFGPGLDFFGPGLDFFGPGLDFSGPVEIR